MTTEIDDMASGKYDMDNPLDYICEVILPHVLYTINFTKQI